jgi:hypothetical protein
VGAYFAAGQVTSGTAIFFEHANTRAFIDLRRILIGKPLLNAPYMLDYIMRERVPLDWDALRRSGLQLTLLATPADDRRRRPGELPRAVAFSDFDSLDDLLAALHAGSRVPFAAGRAPFAYRGRRFWDAALLEPIPVQTALADGCTHVLSLLSLPDQAHRRRSGRVERSLASLYLRQVSPALHSGYRRNGSARARICTWLDTARLKASAPPFVEAIALPSSEPVIGRMELRGPVLRAGARAGAQTLLSAFGTSPDRASEIVDAIAPPIRLNSVSDDLGLTTS